MAVGYKAFSIAILCLSLIVFICAVLLLRFAIKLKLNEARSTTSDQPDCGEEEELNSIRSGNPLDESELVSRNDL